MADLPRDIRELETHCGKYPNNILHYCRNHNPDFARYGAFLNPEHADALKDIGIRRRRWTSILTGFSPIELNELKAIANVLNANPCQLI